uniref:Uncharacterized protein n=1 Tax=Anguilla anguilla TaxID=7936 RepID=A0A0E9Q6S4_ANGAN
MRRWCQLKCVCAVGLDGYVLVSYHLGALNYTLGVGPPHCWAILDQFRRMQSSKCMQLQPAAAFSLQFTS